MVCGSIKWREKEVYNLIGEVIKCINWREKFTKNKNESS